MPQDSYVRFDELDGLPMPNRDNYVFELDYFAFRLPKRDRVLQVGSMDGVRILRLLGRRPDLAITGLEIDPDLVNLSNRHVRDSGREAAFITADITAPPANLGYFDSALCLNNTLGFIPDYPAALQNMRNHAGKTYVSVFGEKFDDRLAIEYFGSVGLEVDATDTDTFMVRHVGPVRRFRHDEAASWGTILTATPLGYLIAVE